MPVQLDIELDEGSGVPLYRQVYEALRAMIASGRLETGSQLPSLRELAADLAVSSITVRKAYDELETAGLIVRMRGSGTFVAERIHQRSRAQARREAEMQLRKAIDRARDLGLDDAEIRLHLDHLLDRPSDRPWRA